MSIASEQNVRYMEDSKIIEKIGQKGVLATLYAISQGRRCVADLRRTWRNKEGVGSSKEVKHAIATLVEFGFVKIDEERTPTVPVYYKITETGQDILSTLCSLFYPRILLDFKKKKEELRKAFIELGKRIVNPNEIIWFGQLGSIVKYAKQEHIDMVRADVDHLMGGLSILYLFSIFESHIKWEDWNRFGALLGQSKMKMKILKAYRHVRHSMSHKSHGARAWHHRSDFNFIISMNDDEMEDERHNIERFRNMIHLDPLTDKITIDPNAGIHLHELMNNMIQQATAKAYSSEESSE